MKPHLLLAVFAARAVLAAEPPEPKFTAQDLDRGVQIGYGVAIADVDGDKLPDILLADKTQIRWYKNPGKRGVEWPKYVIAENLTKQDNVCIAAQDIDGDGKCEVAVGAEWNPGDTVNSGAVFYLIPPADRTQKWEPVKFPNVEPVTHRMKWMHLRKKEWGLVVLPLHGRGNKNGEGAPVKVLLYHPPTPLNDPKGEWKSEVIDESMHMTHNFQVGSRRIADQTALIIAGKEGLLECVRTPNGWTHGKLFADKANPTSEIRQGKLARSFTATIEPMHGNSLVVYDAAVKTITIGQQPQVDPTFLSRTVLTDKLIQGHALACGDLLGVKSDQIVVGWRGNIPPKPEDKVGIAVWTAMDDEGGRWRETLVDDGGTACEDMTLADLDGDGKLDIIAAGRATHNLRVLWNDR